MNNYGEEDLVVLRNEKVVLTRMYRSKMEAKLPYLVWTLDL
jgi:hypothetical protein